VNLIEAAVIRALAGGGAYAVLSRSCDYAMHERSDVHSARSGGRRRNRRRLPTEYVGGWRGRKEADLSSQGMSIAKAYLYFLFFLMEYEGKKLKGRV